MSNNQYNWRTSLNPEKPYNYDYSKAFVYEMSLSESGNVKIDFATALNMVKTADNIAVGLDKILYLSGVFYNGENSGYPSMSEVNPALKLPDHTSAAESLNWFITEAEKYNTTVSFKVDLMSAYEDSPLFDTYFEKDLLLKDNNGNYIIRNGHYYVNLKKEEEIGYLERRINKFIDTFSLQKTGTVALCNFGYVRSNCVSISEFRELRRKVIRYLKREKIDSVIDYLYYENTDGEKEEDLVGLCPMVLNLSQTLEEYMERPAKLLCGVTASNRFKECGTKNMGKLFGESFNTAEIFENKKNYAEKLFYNFCTKFVKYRLLNSYERLFANVTGTDVVVSYSKNTATYYSEDRITINGVTAKIGNEYVLPTPWYERDTALLFTEKGGRCDWNLSKILGFGSAQNVVLCELTPEGLSTKKRLLGLKDGMLLLDLEPEKPAAFIISRM